MALGSTNREVIITAGEVLFLETKLAASSALLVIWPPRNQTKKLSFFEPAFLLLNTTKAQTKLRKPQYLRTASTAEQPSIDPAQSSKVHTQYIQCVDQSATMQASRHEKASQVLLRRAMCQVRVFKFSRFFFGQVPKTGIPVHIEPK